MKLDFKRNSSDPISHIFQAALKQGHIPHYCKCIKEHLMKRQSLAGSSRVSFVLELHICSQSKEKLALSLG